MRISSDCSLSKECIVAALSYFDCVSLLMMRLSHACAFFSHATAGERVNEHEELLPRGLPAWRSMTKSEYVARRKRQKTMLYKERDKCECKRKEKHIRAI